MRIDNSRSHVPSCGTPPLMPIALLALSFARQGCCADFDTEKFISHVQQTCVRSSSDFSASKPEPRRDVEALAEPTAHTVWRSSTPSFCARRALLTAESEVISPENGTRASTAIERPVNERTADYDDQSARRPPGSVDDHRDEPTQQWATRGAISDDVAHSREHARPMARASAWRASSG